ncbi:sensor histidine kinase [Paenibacillus psychroresistens]|uniref:histidine kinase n=1 Tax=Paenibacillus psychroresistens TaxID=1778678 RepID=A0A6B8RQ61_9BACL|nr:sensor histidine kinase [Paenibacillus psychroresistens]QGQ97977.1 sensor histidine kinase [Paenibacillus psychroresistens]
MRHFITRLFLNHLSTKLVLLIVPLLLFTIGVISYFYYGSTSDIISENVRASTKQAAKQSADYLSLILTVGTDVGQQIFHDTRIQQVIISETKGNLSVDQKTDIKDSVDEILNNVMYTSSFVRSIYLLKEQGNSWGSGMFNESKMMRYTLKEHDWYNDVVNGKVDDLWLPLHYDPFSGGGENTELVLTLIKPLRNLETREVLGVIVINMDGKLILDAIQRIRLGKTGKFTIVNNRGEIMISEVSEQWNQSLADSELGKWIIANRNIENEFEMKLDHVDQYIVTRNMKNDWTILGTVPIQEVLEGIQKIQLKIWMYSSLLLAAALVIGVLFSRRITSPLKELMNQMSQIGKSDLKARTDVRSQDEIGQLSRRFNQMVGHIELLIGQVNEEEAKKREAEMRALRYQINPHFLFNTLSTIRWMVLYQKYDEAYNGIASLVQLMEASMEKSGVFSSIRDELGLLDKYMVIQQFRYGDNIHLFANVDESLLDLEIPRMLLQPIVENAVFHGIAPQEQGGRIDISMELSTESETTLLIWIKDNGLGINPEHISGLLRTSSEQRAGMFGIGLNHVHETIQLYYGKASGVFIESELGIGTVIRLELNLRGDKNDI